MRQGRKRKRKPKRVYSIRGSKATLIPLGNGTNRRGRNVTAKAEVRQRQNYDVLRRAQTEVVRGYKAICCIGPQTWANNIKEVDLIGGPNTGRGANTLNYVVAQAKIGFPRNTGKVEPEILYDDNKDCYKREA